MGNSNILSVTFWEYAPSVPWQATITRRGMIFCAFAAAASRDCTNVDSARSRSDWNARLTLNRV